MTQCQMPTVVGTYAEYIVLWPQHAAQSDCPKGGIHAARNRFSTDWQGEHCPSLHAPEARGWEGGCDYCQKQIPWDDPELRVSSGMGPVYDTPNGKLGPGDMFWVDHRSREWCPGGWTNCDGLHLHVICPNGVGWDIDSRANNCTLPDDTTHRCWIREGTPPRVTAGKAGHTCTAGAGSIQAGDYHGFLRDGRFES